MHPLVLSYYRAEQDRLAARQVAAGITTVEEVLSVTTAKEVERSTNTTGDTAASIAVANK